MILALHHKVVEPPKKTRRMILVHLPVTEKLFQDPMHQNMNQKVTKDTNYMPLCVLRDFVVQQLYGVKRT
ncbi:MAG TPA: hypothetical protein DCF33_07865 [Saprospirales bacterium]|nr:hypothetical protein [Saprospirales bacterium]